MGRTKGATNAKPKINLKGNTTRPRQKPKPSPDDEFDPEFDGEKEAAASASINHIGKYRCVKCGCWRDEIKGFSIARSPMYEGNGNRIPVCKQCVENMYIKYKNELGSHLAATKRICMKLDIYYSESMADAVETGVTTSLPMTNYIRKMMLPAFVDKTYDTYIRESCEEAVKTKLTVPTVDKVDDKDLQFWGFGFDPQDYPFLNNKYAEWTASYECNDKSQQTIFQNICILELQKLKALRSGDKIDGILNALDKQLGSGNLKPIQNKKDNLADQNTFGTLIQKWENEEPIPEPDPEWKDVDGIVRYVSIWFLGHLCKMLKIKNTYSKLYEDEIAKLTVEKPTYYEDSEAAFEDIFDTKGGNDDA